MEQRPEIEETISIFGLNPEIAAQYISATLKKLRYLEFNQFEAAGRMRDVQFELIGLHNTGQQQVLSFLDVSLRELVPKIGTQA